MARRLSTPYPRHCRIEQLTKIKDEDEGDGNFSENGIKYRRQSNIMELLPKRGREVFAEILNNEWELRGGDVFPANTNQHTAEAENQVSGSVIERVEIGAYRG